MNVFVEKLKLMGKTDRLDKSINWLIRIFLLFLSAYYICAYLWIAVNRMAFPFELEWIEGGMLQHVFRVLAGQNIFVAPSLEFVPSIYNPLFFYLGAMMCKILGPGFFPLRLLSFLSSIGAFFFLYRIVRRETGSGYYGIVSVGFFAATYKLGFSWFDLARVDSLSLMFLLAAIDIIRRVKVKHYIVYSAVLFFLAFFAKQSVLFAVLPFLLFLYFCQRTELSKFAFTFFLLVAAEIIIQNAFSHGWYSYYIFQLPASHHLDMRNFYLFWLRDLLGFFPIACILVPLYFFDIFGLKNKTNDWFVPTLSISLLGLAWILRLHVEGIDNVLIPAYACLAILMGLVASKYEQKKWLGRVIQLLLIIQLGWLYYNPLTQIPSGKDLAAGQRLVVLLSKIEGEVFIPAHGYLADKTGKKIWAHQMATYDVLRGKRKEVADKLRIEIEAAIKERKFSAVIIDVQRPGWNESNGLSFLRQYYTKEELLPDQADFILVSGWRTRPNYIFKP